jgi:cob(I)alamin adenosyltransferase
MKLTLSIGVALLHVTNYNIRTLLVKIQNDMFDVGADLCTPVIDNPKVKPLRVTQDMINFLRKKSTLLTLD